MSKDTYKKILDAVKQGKDISKMFNKEELKEFATQQIKSKVISAVGPYLGYALIVCILLGLLLAVIMAIIEFIGKLLGAFNKWWGYLWGGTNSLISDADVANLYYELLELGVDFNEVGAIGEHTFLEHDNDDLDSFLDEYAWDAGGRKTNLHEAVEEYLNSKVNEKKVIKYRNAQGKDKEITFAQSIVVPKQVKNANGNSFPTTANYPEPTVRDVFTLNYWLEVVQEADKTILESETVTDISGAKYIKQKTADVAQVDPSTGETIKETVTDEDGNTQEVEAISEQPLTENDGSLSVETAEEAATRLLEEMQLVFKEGNAVVGDDEKYEESEHKDKPLLEVSKGVGLYLNKYLLAEVETFSARNAWTFADSEFTGSIYVSDGNEELKEKLEYKPEWYNWILDPIGSLVVVGVDAIGDALDVMKSKAVERSEINGQFYITTNQTKIEPADFSTITSSTSTSGLTNKTTETIPLDVTTYINEYALPWQYSFAFHENTLSPDVGYEVALMVYKYHDLWLQLRQVETGLLKVYEGIATKNGDGTANTLQTTRMVTSQSLATSKIFPRRIATWYETKDYSYDYIMESDFYLQKTIDSAPIQTDMGGVQSALNPTSSWFGLASGLSEADTKKVYGADSGRFEKGNDGVTIKAPGMAKNYPEVQRGTAPVVNLTVIEIEITKQRVIADKTFTTYQDGEKIDEKTDYDTNVGGEYSMPDKTTVFTGTEPRTTEPTIENEAEESRKKADSSDEKYKTIGYEKNDDGTYVYDERGFLIPIKAHFKYVTSYSNYRTITTYEYKYYSYVQYQYEYDKEDGGIENAAIKTTTETRPRMGGITRTGQEEMTRLLFPDPEIEVGEEESVSEEDQRLLVRNHGDNGTKDAPNPFLADNEDDAVRYYKSNNLEAFRDEYSEKSGDTSTKVTRYYYKEHLFISTAAENIIKSLHDFYKQSAESTEDYVQDEYGKSSLDVEEGAVKIDEDDENSELDTEATTKKISEITEESQADEYLNSPYKQVRDLISFFVDKGVIDGKDVASAVAANTFSIAASWLFEETQYTITGSSAAASVITGTNVEVKAPLSGTLTQEGEFIVLTTKKLGQIYFKNLEVDPGLLDNEVVQGQVIGTTNGNLGYSRTDDAGRAVDAKKELETLQAISNEDFVWPLPGNSYISSHCGNRIHPITGAQDMHKGIDIPAPEGTPIVAYMAGTVVTKAYDAGGYGNYVVLKHVMENGTTRYTVYAHMVSPALVNVGDEVEKNQPIGRVGTTGSSTGNHLHFEIREGSSNGRVIDPEKDLEIYLK